ncbi:hypothetical protein O6H91_16G059100 [Diphasiastrum complanatum]|uniref:Uncharacterized protein n=1 Tax=Diphasiastrum complanatum TaxID=34168 RepID=A0ACC2BCM2_DIPCM|nr:hypothetical protein O6H91_16G059100 [Diphasiastrum complanatum]
MSLVFFVRRNRATSYGRLTHLLSHRRSSPGHHDLLLLRTYAAAAARLHNWADAATVQGRRHAAIASINVLGEFGFDPAVSIPSRFLLSQVQNLGPFPSLSRGVSSSASAGIERGQPIRKILIANRGEIACRVIRTAKRLGVKTVAVYSEADKDALHVRSADEAVCIGPPPAQLSYLSAQAILAAAHRTGADAVHPGYGFLSENAKFAELCVDNGISFIGPPASAIHWMGDKSASKKLMSSAGVPVVPGYHGEDQNAEFLKSEASKIGYPILIKPTLGGGGKGMKIVEDERDFLECLKSAQREALTSFGDNRVLIEKYIARPRHVEVQVFADKHGNVVHLFERDCSVQRRHQKIIEEAPAPLLLGAFRASIGEAAVDATKAVGYESAGTVEFIVDTISGEFYFMEMNTRLQVEHPVTEMVTGQDLVEWQINVANGELLPLTQAQITLSGHAFEARIYAENVPRGFLPAAGVLHHYRPPSVSSMVRIETGVEKGDLVSVHYDPMIAKLVVWGQDRTSALRKLHNCLSEFQVAGVPTNIEFLKKLSTHASFVAGEVETNFIEHFKEQLLPTENVGLFKPLQNEVLQSAALVAAVNSLKQYCMTSDKVGPDALWLSSAFRVNHQHSQTMDIQWTGEENTAKNSLSLEITHKKSGGYDVKFQTGEHFEIMSNNDWHAQNGANYNLDIDGLSSNVDFVSYVQDSSIQFQIWRGDIHHQFALPLQTFESSDNDDQNTDAKTHDKINFETKAGVVIAPMAGLVVKVLAERGKLVNKGDALLVMEAMKMEDNHSRMYAQGQVIITEKTTKR